LRGDLRKKVEKKEERNIIFHNFGGFYEESLPRKIGDFLVENKRNKIVIISLSTR
jgi:hypothetical protein